MLNHLFIQCLTKQKILPLFYHSDKNVCLNIIKSLYKAGIRCVEFTNRGDHALENFKAIIQERNEKMKDLIICIGTIKKAEEVDIFIRAGADVLISPMFDIEISKASKNKILWIPACMTPSEIHVAEQNHHTLIKLFPGNVLDTAFISAVKSVFPNISFLITGGVEADKKNIQKWIESGVIGVGLGSKLITNDILNNKQYDTLETITYSLIH